MRLSVSPRRECALIGVSPSETQQAWSAIAGCDLMSTCHADVYVFPTSTRRATFLISRQPFYVANGYGQTTCCVCASPDTCLRGFVLSNCKLRISCSRVPAI